MRTDRNSFSAIALLGSPWAASRATSRSRRVSGDAVSTRASAGVTTPGHAAASRRERCATAEDSRLRSTRRSARAASAAASAA